MSDETLTRVLAGLQGRRFRGRSDLYRWLRANYKRLGPRLEQDQISWVVLAREIAAAGLNAVLTVSQRIIARPGQ